MSSRNATEEGPLRKRPAHPLLSTSCAASVLAVAALTLAAYLESWTVLFWQFPHFKVYYAVAAIGVAAFAVALRAWRWLALAVVCAAVNLWAIIPWYIPPSSSVAVQPNLRLVVANVQTANRQHELLSAWLEQVDPELVLLQEVNHRWLDELVSIRERYPHRVEQLKPESSGVVLWSKLPLNNVVTGQLGQRKARAVRADVTVSGRSLHLIGLHARSPRAPLRSASRDLQLAAAAQAAREEPLCILMGDLNTTMWTRGYRSLEQDSGLVNTRQGYGILPTWPTQRRPFLIPLDHCLCSPDIATLACQLGPDVGSDHLPLCVELHIPPTR